MMFGLRKLVIAGGLLAFTTTMAFADETELVKSANLASRVYSGRSIDVIGIKPGMSIDDVTKILLDAYDAEPNQIQTTLSTSFKSISMSSLPYVSALNTAKADDRISISFGTPSTGSTVVGVTRTLTFSNTLTAPTISALVNQLDAKYGAESCRLVMNWGLSLNWLFNANSFVVRPPNQCPLGADNTFDANRMEAYRQQMASGTHFVLHVTINQANSDHDRAGSIEVTIDDEAAKFQTFNEALKQLSAAAAAAYDKKATPQAAPRL